MQHTPGPWRTHRPHHGTIYIDAPIGNGMLQEVAAIGPTEGAGQQEANARLIVAAPELHELLQTFTEWARQIAGREGLPQGIRSAAANLHDDGKRLIAKAIPEAA